MSLFKKLIPLLLLLSAILLTGCQAGPGAEEQIKNCQDAYEKLMASEAYQMDYTMELPDGGEQSGTYVTHNQNAFVHIRSAANHDMWLLTYEGESYSKREADAPWSPSDGGYVSSYGPERLNIFAQDLKYKSSQLVDGETVITVITEDHGAFTFHIDEEGFLRAVDLEVPAGVEHVLCHSRYTFTYDHIDEIDAVIAEEASNLG